MSAQKSEITKVYFICITPLPKKQMILSVCFIRYAVQAHQSASLAITSWEGPQDTSNFFLKCWHSP